jgi:hypothetical protein
MFPPCTECTFLQPTKDFRFELVYPCPSDNEREFFNVYRSNGQCTDPEFLIKSVTMDKSESKLAVSIQNEYNVLKKLHHKGIIKAKRLTA